MAPPPTKADLIGYATKNKIITPAAASATMADWYGREATARQETGLMAERAPVKREEAIKDSQANIPVEVQRQAAMQPGAIELHTKLSVIDTNASFDAMERAAKWKKTFEENNNTVPQKELLSWVKTDITSSVKEADEIVTSIKKAAESEKIDLSGYSSPIIDNFNAYNGPNHGVTIKFITVGKGEEAKTIPVVDQNHEVQQNIYKVISDEWPDPAKRSKLVKRVYSGMSQNQLPSKPEQKPEQTTPVQQPAPATQPAQTTPPAGPMQQLTTQPSTTTGVPPTVQQGVMPKQSPGITAEQAKSNIDAVAAEKIKRFQNANRPQ
jgi:hypothetical protein